MQRFTEDGMMIFPNPDFKEVPQKDVLVLREGFCPNGHSLMSSRIHFNKFNGIYLSVKTPDGRKGFIGISPVYDQHARITVDIDLKSGETAELSCPVCAIHLPVFQKCSCGADLVTIYYTKRQNINDSVVICSRVDCLNSSVKNGADLLTKDYFESPRQTL
jgi:hypothetical protein